MNVSLYFINFLAIFGRLRLTAYLQKMLLIINGASVSGKVFLDRGVLLVSAHNISFGKSVSLGHNNRILAFNKVQIGDYVQTAIGLTIVAGTHDKSSYESLSRQEIKIGSGCWVGANVTLLGNVKVGKGCIIGAGSLVNKDIPDYSIVVGNPARVIGTRYPAENIIHPFGTYKSSEI